MKTFRSISLVLAICIGVLEMKAQSRIVKDFTPVCDSVSVLLSDRTGVEGKLRLRNIMKRGNSLDFYFTVSLSDFPWRESDYRWFRTTLHSLFPDRYRGYTLGEIYSKREKAAALVVRELGYDGNPVHTRHRKADPRGHTVPLVTRYDRPFYTEGLSGRHIALWPSHGRYYDQNSGRWIWQRPVLFTSVEDMLSTGFVLPYLVPMLENAGAYVMLPRERDTSHIEIIIDNDHTSGGRGTGTYTESGKWEDAGTGFADTAAVYTGLANPFTAGTARKAQCGKAARAVWTPDIPERGRYAVYISYKTLENSSCCADYTVHHLGGETRFLVNQKAGGGTWIYLGTFEFDKGRQGYVELLSTAPDGQKPAKGSVVSADAVKIGGGMGNIARNISGDNGSLPETSGMPRYAEAARYWLQWAGMDSTVFSHNNLKDDYRDDLFSRGDWVDFMSGGSAINPKKEGRRIPVDLTFAFHSDAGIAQNDSIVGTLTIYTRTNIRADRLPDGENRLTAREFADIVQSQVANDLKACIDTSWNRRQIWDRAYRESRTPPCPTILLENFSHQNFSDMRCAMDPSFRFILSRAIYKGMLKYLSNRYGCPYTVQPLPVHSMSAVITDSCTVDISWLPREDRLEPTAMADRYMLYTRVDDGGFDNGREADIWTSPDGRVHTFIKIRPGHIYSYMVTAVNGGGESFPSEILSAGIPDNGSGLDSLFIVVNNFTRVSAPAWFDTPDIAGFNSSADAGMPYISDISYTGDMYEFRRSSGFRSNVNPGFGASSGEHSGRPVPGNTFDYTYTHGKAIFASGYPFCSASSAAFAADSTLYGAAGCRYAGGERRFFAADIICGEQVTTLTGKTGTAEKYRVFPAALQNAIRTFTSRGGNILVSGSHIGTDIWDSIFPVETDSTFRAESIDFAEDVLGYTWVTGHASRTGVINFTDSPFHKAAKGSPSGTGMSREALPADWTVGSRTDIYRVVSPDGISPSNRHSYIISEYGDSRIPCGVCYPSPAGYKAVSFGFPLEAVAPGDGTDMIIDTTIKFFRQ